MLKTHISISSCKYVNWEVLVPWIMFRLGVPIRWVRVLRGWTQEHLAEKAIISLSFLGHIERGMRKANLETLVILANALEVSKDCLLSGSLTMKVYGKSGKISGTKQTAL